MTEKTTADERTALLAHADVIISGVGKPGLVQSAEIKAGVYIFDAGASESSGVVQGDIDSACAEKAALFTPVPGGIGPLTIACLLENVYQAASRS